MILCYGEILADMIGTKYGGAVAYERYAGGAPFNVACGIERCGGKSGFVGSVGDDLIGRYLQEYASRRRLAYTDIRTRKDRNTTLAFVELDETGERSFCFYRKNTADAVFDEDSLRAIDGADIVHLGSLMLSLAEGRDFAARLVRRVRGAAKLLSFDVNYREDVFPDAAAAKRAYEGFAKEADIVKYSREELELFTGKSGLEGLADLAAPGKLVCVTLGSEGSAYACGSLTGRVPAAAVKAVDTTGAGDAFYSALLSRLDGKDIASLTEEQLNAAFRFANAAGALAVSARGAIDSLGDEAAVTAFLNR